MRLPKLRACISGMSEVLGKRTHKSALALHLACGRGAILDSGLEARAVDGLLTGIPMVESYPSYSAMVGEYLGLRGLRYTSTAGLGGANPCAMVHLAARAVSDGWCQAVLVIYADNRLTAMSRDTAVERMADAIHPEFEKPLGPTVVAMYALAASRHMLVHGSTPEQFAHVAVQARANAAKTEGSIMREAITVQDVLSSKMIAYPLRLLDCCLISDFAGAVVVTTPELARSSGHAAVHVLGGGEGHTHAHLTQSPDLLHTGASLSGAQAFSAAGVKRSEMDFAQLYDCFTIAVVLELEELGFCERGEGAALAASGALAPNGRLPFNTNGGMLSFHNGGIYHLTEAVRQLRWEAGDRQVGECELGFVHGNGGIYAHHASVILSRGGAS